MTGNDWLTLFAAFAIASLIPIVYAIVDVARRPAWQFSPGRKVLWAVTLGIGWLVLWPVALISSIVYLTVLRRRFPPSSSLPPQGSQFPHFGHYGRDPHVGGGPYGGGAVGPYGGGGPYSGGGPYGAPGPYGAAGPYGAPDPYGPGPSGGPYRPGYGYPTQEPNPPVPAPLPPAGWYPDPAGSASERWWDGKGWSDHLR